MTSTSSPRCPHRRGILAALACLLLLAAACGDDAGSELNAARDASGSTGPQPATLGVESDTSSTDGGESTTTGDSTTTLAAEPCPLPQPLPRGVAFGPGVTRLHRATTAFAESALLLREAFAGVGDYSPGWGAREPVASALYRMQSDLYTLASLVERTFAADGSTYDPAAGWTFPEDPYPLAALAEPWALIPQYQAVALTGLFETGSGTEARAIFESGGVCALVAAFSTAMDAAVAASDG